MDWAGKKELDLERMTMTDLVFGKNLELPWLMCLRSQLRVAWIPFGRWCRREGQPSRLRRRELSRPRCYRSVWGDCNCPVLLAHCKCWLRWLSFSSLSSCYSLSLSKTAFSSLLLLLLLRRRFLLLSPPPRMMTLLPTSSLSLSLSRLKKQHTNTTLSLSRNIFVYIYYVCIGA